MGLGFRVDYGPHSTEIDVWLQGIVFVVAGALNAQPPGAVFPWSFVGLVEEGVVKIFVVCPTPSGPFGDFWFGTGNVVEVCADEIDNLEPFDEAIAIGVAVAVSANAGFLRVGGQNGERPGGG